MHSMLTDKAVKWVALGNTKLMAAPREVITAIKKTRESYEGKLEVRLKGGDVHSEMCVHQV